MGVNPFTELSEYKKGLPCMLGEMVGRLVGESGDGSWQTFDGTPVYSVPLFSTPHGTVIKTGISKLTDISESGMKQLKAFEEDASNQDDDPLYAGYLSEKEMEL